jgi:hypothetical protein
MKRKCKLFYNQKNFPLFYWGGSGISALWAVPCRSSDSVTRSLSSVFRETRGQRWRTLVCCFCLTLCDVQRACLWQLFLSAFHDYVSWFAGGGGVPFTHSRANNIVAGCIFVPCYRSWKKSGNQKLIKSTSLELINFIEENINNYNIMLQ